MLGGFPYRRALRHVSRDRTEMNRDIITAEIPDYQTLMLPLLRLAAEGDTPVRKAIAQLAEQFKLTRAHPKSVLMTPRRHRLPRFAVMHNTAAIPLMW